jgi:hypothetical protein
MGTYEAFQRDLAPPWLGGPRGQELLETQGEAKDLVVEGAKDAVKASFVEGGPDDALPYLGSARNLVRYPGDTVDGFRQRIRNAWETWTFAGVEATVLSELTLYLPDADWTIVKNRDWTPDLPPDGDTAWWSRFWVLLDAGPWVSDGLWDDPGRWGDEGTWDSDATPSEVAAVRGIVRKWKPGHTICPAIFVGLDANVDRWGPFGAWDHGDWDSDDAQASW